MDTRSRFTRDEIVEMLAARGDRQQELFGRACAVRDERAGHQGHLRGVVEVSSHCRRDCSYCAMRRSSHALHRYRAEPAQVVEAARRVHHLGIRAILLQGGEDPRVDGAIEEVLPVLKRDLGLRVILNLGQRSRQRLAHFRELGADAYIMKFETSDGSRYQAATGSPLAPRLENLAWLRELGYIVSTGNIVGLPGQSLQSLADDFVLAQSLRPDWMSSAPFVPSEGTPWGHEPPGDIETTLNCIALSRLMFPDGLIPSVSALEKLQAGGQARGLRAGANVVTVNCTPAELRERYPIYSRDRFLVSLQHAQAALADAGLATSTSA